LNSEMMEKGKLLDGMISVLNTAKANMEAMAIELKNCSDDKHLDHVLKIGHKAIWSLANNFTELESGLQSRVQTINDCKEYLVKAE
jgi:hypothetical protein